MLKMTDTMGELYDLDVAWHTANGSSNAECDGFEYYSSLPRGATIQASINVTMNVDMNSENSDFIPLMALNLAEHAYGDVEQAVIDGLLEIAALDTTGDVAARQADIAKTGAPVAQRFCL